MFVKTKVQPRIRKRLSMLVMLCLLLPSLVVMPAATLPVDAATEQKKNPSYEEIAAKLERIAREKNIPSQILKAIAFKESSWRQWDKDGNVVMSKSEKRPAIGIMQIATYDPNDTELIERLKNDIDFNIAYGADLLNEKFALTPTIGNGDRNVLENWYFAIWAYNSWSELNNPWVAEARGTKAYQDKVLELMATEYLPGGVVTPVEVTPLPKESLPTTGVPDRSTTWATPEPVHYGDLASDEAPAVERLGEGRIDTAIAIARAGWPEGAETVVLARSDDFPDVLAGVPLAYRLNAPILLTPPTALDERVASLLLELRPVHIYLLGGEAALGPQVVERLKALGWMDGEIRRLAGADRYETAAKIAEQFPEAREAAIATGLKFPDALGFAPLAAREGIPILLVNAERVPEVTRAYLGTRSVERLTVIGGTAVISDEVYRNLAQIAGLSDDRITRVAGDDRYLTSLEIARQYSPEPQLIDLTTGEDFAYPLVGAVLSARHNGAMLLVRPRGSNDQVESYLQDLPNPVQLRVFGGQEAVPESVVIEVLSYLKNR